MRVLRNRSVGKKLTVIGVLTNGIALILAFLGFMAHEFVVFRQNSMEDHAATAQILSQRCAPMLALNDAEGTAQQLNAIAVHPHIDTAVLYDVEGRIFARYQRPGAGDVLSMGAISALGHHWSLAGLQTVERVTVDGKRVGTLQLASNLRELHDRIVISALVGGAVLLGAGILAIGITRRLQRFITAPVSHLVDVASSVAKNGNYTVRAKKQSDDELGRLVDSFNAMLTQIELGDLALREAHDRLEARVEERTRELQQEVAERRRSEQALNESHERLHIVTRATSDAVWDWNIIADSRCWNENYQTLFGYRLDEVPVTIGGWQSRIHPDDEAAVSAGLIAALGAQRSLWSSEYRYRRDDGSYAYVFDRGYIIRDEQGQPIRMIGAMQDITDRKLAQEEVAREKARLQLIFESVPVGICLDDVRPGGERTRFLNDSHLLISGLTREQAMQGDFRKISEPADLAPLTELRGQLDRGEINRFSVEKRLQRPDGSSVWVAYSVQRRHDGNGGWHDLSTIVDITDLKRAQEEAAREQARFKFIFEAVPVGISLVLPGQDGTHLVNPAHERITGVAAEQSSQPGIFASVTHPDDLRRQEEFVRKYVRGEINHFTIEKRYLHAGGTVVWAALTSRMFTDAVTGRKLSVTTLVDITERKHAEAKLAETHKQLLDTSRQAGMAEVATGVLHNVGNVLNSVNVSATLLSDIVRQSKSDRVARLRELLAEHEKDLGRFFTEDPRGRQVPGYLQTLASHLAKERGDLLAELDGLRKNVEHIKDIVAMQQSYARVSGVSETVTVTELIEDALRMNVGAFERHRVNLVREYESLPVVTVQKHKVLQILVNLLRNAKHACEDSGKESRQVTVRASAEGGRVRIAVTDNGVGILAENLTRIFAHGFTTRKNGHGFGLHSGALAARELGGSLTARSDGPGCGATFILDLPETLEVKAA